MGRYSADLMFRDSSDRLVVVENMFGATDHDHLGKLITYSAGLDAGIAVLVAEEFRDEHRSALDWLNRISLNDFAFFGVVLEAWRIGDSDPAPRLRVDTKPDDWSRTVRSSGDSQRAQTYRRFWGEFLPRLHEAHPDWSRVRTPSKDHWMSFGSARSDLYRYNPAFGAALRGTCRVELYVDSPTITPSDVFDWLFERRKEIEAEVPQEIDWDRLDGNRACRIAVYFRDEVRVTAALRPAPPACAQATPANARAHGASNRRKGALRAARGGLLTVLLGTPVFPIALFSNAPTGRAFLDHARQGAHSHREAPPPHAARTRILEHAEC